MKSDRAVKAQGVHERFSIRRARAVFVLLFMALLSLILSTATFAVSSGELDRMVIEPLEKRYQALLENLEAPANVVPTVLPPTLAPIITPMPTARPVNRDASLPQQQPQQQTQQIQYVYPTYPPLPTAIPGRPGSKEWDEQFWKNWDQMGEDIEAAKQRSQESREKFCAENPSLCD